MPERPYDISKINFNFAACSQVQGQHSSINNDPVSRMNLINGYANFSDTNGSLVNDGHMNTDCHRYAAASAMANIFNFNNNSVANVNACFQSPDDYNDTNSSSKQSLNQGENSLCLDSSNESQKSGESNLDDQSLSKSPSLRVYKKQNGNKKKSLSESGPISRASYMCRKCKAHGVSTAVRQHKKECQFSNCKCVKCQLVEKGRQVVARQIALYRDQRAGNEGKPKGGSSKKNSEKNSFKYDSFKGSNCSPNQMPYNAQNSFLSSNMENLDLYEGTMTENLKNMMNQEGPHCRRCRNHNIAVTWRGHKKNCPYRTCSCGPCKLINERKDTEKTLRDMIGFEEEKSFLYSTMGNAIKNTVPTKIIHTNQSYSSQSQPRNEVNNNATDLTLPTTTRSNYEHSPFNLNILSYNPSDIQNDEGKKEDCTEKPFNLWHSKASPIANELFHNQILQNNNSEFLFHSDERQTLGVYDNQQSNIDPSEPFYPVNNNNFPNSSDSSDIYQNESVNSAVAVATAAAMAAIVPKTYAYQNYQNECYRSYYDNCYENTDRLGNFIPQPTENGSEHSNSMNPLLSNSTLSHENNNACPVEPFDKSLPIDIHSKLPFVTTSVKESGAHYFWNPSFKKLDFDNEERPFINLH